MASKILVEVEKTLLKTLLKPKLWGDPKKPNKQFYADKCKIVLISGDAIILRVRFIEKLKRGISQKLKYVSVQELSFQDDEFQSAKVVFTDMINTQVMDDNYGFE